MSICQLQKFLLFSAVTILLGSCSSSKVEVKHEHEVDQKILASWQKVPFRFTHLDKDDGHLTHPFFDIDPSLSKERRLVNFFITTPEESLFKYNFDLYSGKLYKDRNYCPVDDVWDNYKGDVYKPNFTQGIVPRVYNENKLPQKIIVFSNADKIVPFKLMPTSYDTARVVGSVILENCASYPCDLKSKWKASQILLAVNPRDPAYSGVNLLGELKKKVDWPLVKSILVNQDGVHQIGKKYMPAYRISKEFSIDETFKYFDKFSKFINMEEQVKFRDECFKLYDDVWEKFEKIRTEKYGQQTKFLEFFKDFYNKNSDQFYQCQKLVRPANINENDKRLWFFSYLQAFTKLEKNGFYYSCAENAWAYNPKVDDNHYFVDQNKELKGCRARDFEKAFDHAINGMGLMKNQINKSYRFIEYDTQRGGSHQKIYGWVEDVGLKHACKNLNSAKKESSPEIFPQDVVWPNLSAEEEKIIK